MSDEGVWTDEVTEEQVDELIDWLEECTLRELLDAIDFIKAKRETNGAAQ